MPKFDKQIQSVENVLIFPKMMKALWSVDSEDEVSEAEEFSVGKLRNSATDYTQKQFAAVYHINYATLKYWERKPHSLPSHGRAYLHLIEVAPKLVEKLLYKRPEEVREVVKKIEAMLDDLDN